MYNIRKHFFLCLSVTLSSVFFVCCKKKSSSTTNTTNPTSCTITQAAGTPFNFNLTPSQFAPLNVVGAYTYLSGFGIKGILVYRVSQNQFVAFERSCTYDGCTKTNAKVWVQNGNVFEKDSICGSSFSITDGSVQVGPATFALYQYHTSWDGVNLTIYN